MWDLEHHILFHLFVKQVLNHTSTLQTHCWNVKLYPNLFCYTNKDISPRQDTYKRCHERISILLSRKPTESIHCSEVFKGKHTKKPNVNIIRIWNVCNECEWILSNSFKGQADQQKAFLQESFYFFMLYFKYFKYFSLFWHERCHLKKYNPKGMENPIKHAMIIRLWE